ncbi:MAG: DUF58 domain-containing protein [Pirellulaceae bacterium]|nr:DUF58 domain-containing protein [Pirellulaceae bacterium]
MKFATPRTEEGKAVEVELVITNRWPWPIWGLAIERGFSHSTELDVLPVTAISRIGGWSQSHFRWEFVPEIRGRYPVSRPQLVTEFPFGLWKAKRRINVESNLIVWPQRFSLPPVMLSCGEQSFSGQPSESSTGNIGHRTAVREYRRGDSVRQIHWTKTALYDKLVSFEREGFTLTEATIVLDTHPSLHRGTGSQSTFEQSIRIAASVSESLLHQGVKLTINTNTGKFESESRNSPALLDWLALFDNEVKPAQKLSERSPRTPWKRSLRVHITTDLSNSVESDSIVILTTPESSKEAISRVHSRCWMVVKRGVDLSSQIRNGWQSVPRSLQRAI